MRKIHDSRLVAMLGLAVLTVLLTATFANARERECAGDFTLTSETRWGKAILPPGSYSFELDITNDLITIKGRNRTVMVMSQVHDTNKQLESSALILVSRGRKGTVRALHLAGQKKVFLYAVPKETPEEIAQGPLVVKSVPVTLRGK